MMTREDAITKLLDAVEEVVYNNDWPTEAGRIFDTGQAKPSCAILDLVTIIRTFGGEANG